MVPDYVSAPGNFGGDIGPLVHVAPDQKKRRLNVMSRKNVEQIESVRIIWPVIEGQCDLLRTSPAPAESLPKPLSSGSQRLVSGGCQGNTNGSGRKHKHGWIVMENEKRKSESRSQNAEIRNAESE